jgi:hypothetical protein
MLNFLAELYDFIKNRKKYWLLPIFIFLILLSILLVGGQGSVMSPFIYSIF